MGLQKLTSLFGFLAAGYPRELLPAAAGKQDVTPGDPRARTLLQTEALLREAKERRGAAGLETPLEAARFVVFDIETTGFRAHGGDEIIDIAATEVQNGAWAPERQFASLVRPRRKVPDEILRLTGIDPADIAEAPPLPDVLRDFLRFAKDGVLVAYGLRHDLGFLHAVCQRLYGQRVSNRAVDAWQTARWLHPDLGDHSLDTLLQAYGVQVNGRHTALGDSLMTADLWSRFLPALAGRRLHTLGDLYAALALV